MSYLIKGICKRGIIYNGEKRVKLHKVWQGRRKDVFVISSDSEDRTHFVRLHNFRFFLESGDEVVASTQEEFSYYLNKCPYWLTDVDDQKNNPIADYVRKELVLPLEE